MSQAFWNMSHKGDRDLLVWPGIGWSPRTAAGGHVGFRSKAQSVGFIGVPPLVNLWPQLHVSQPDWKMGTTVCCDVLSDVLVVFDPMDCGLQNLSCPWDFQVILVLLAISPPGLSSDPGGSNCTSLAPPALRGRFSTTNFKSSKNYYDCFNACSA